MGVVRADSGSDDILFHLAQRGDNHYDGYRLGTFLPQYDVPYTPQNGRGRERGNARRPAPPNQPAGGRKKEKFRKFKQ